MEFIAHIKKEDEVWKIHSLEDHLLSVSHLSGDFADKFGACSFGRLIGLWHDLGKYKVEFQERIGIKSGYDVEAHLEGKTAKSVKHAVTGAIYTLERFQNSEILKKLVAMPILCHHSGLRNFGIDINSQISDPIETEHLAKVRDAIPSNISLGVELRPLSRSFSDHSLLIRMLFSSLIDADRLDTEKFMSPEKFKERYHKTILLEDLNKLLTDSLSKMGKNSEKTKLNVIRENIRNVVESKSTTTPGFFTLTVPTGGGKTLTSLSFALKHALANKMDRIIYAVPYLSIIEQTGTIFKQILGEDSIVEHHSSIDVAHGTENQQNRLLTENWDHPLIVTTNIQLFESLFSSKTTKLRKIHNLTNSVIILDEAQMIPPDFLQPIIRVMKELVKYYNVTFILCTATQPAFGSRDSINFKFDGIDNAVELAPDPSKLFEDLVRVKINKPEDRKYTHTEIAHEINKNHQCLVIVNRKEDAFGIYSHIYGCKYYLTTNLCAEHRRNILTQIKDHLGRNESVIVVSTQLIEAGVDIDFPVVFRAVSGLDSIAQAAGRCNREGLLKDSNGNSKYGEVFLFHPEKSSPVGHLRQAEQAGMACINQFDNLINPEAFESYFNELFWVKGDLGLDKHGIHKLGQILYFEEINEKFRIIKEDVKQVIVPYGDGKSIIEEIQAIQKKKWNIDYKIIKKAQRYSVNIRTDIYSRLLSDGVIFEVEGIVGYLENTLYYDDLVGFQISAKEQELII